MVNSNRKKIINNILAIVLFCSFELLVCNTFTAFAVDVSNFQQKKQFAEAIKRHQLWLKTDGEKGQMLNISDMNLSGVTVKNCDLSNAVISNIDFSNSLFENVILCKADLTNSNFFHASIINANMERVEADGANFSHAILKQVNFKKAYVKNSKFVFVNENEYKTSLDHFSTFDPYGKLRRKRKHYRMLLDNPNNIINDFSEAELDNADFSNANLEFSIFKYSYLISAKFNNANLVGVDWEGANIEYGQFANAALPLSNFKYCYIRDAKFQKTFLKWAILTDSNIEYSDFSGANLFAADLSDISARGAVFQSSTLDNAILINADLYMADLDKASMINTEIRGANFSRVLFSDTVFECRPGFESSIYSLARAAPLAGLTYKESRLALAELKVGLRREVAPNRQTVWRRS